MSPGLWQVPEVVLRTVRISITCQNSPEYTTDQYGGQEQLEPDIRVKVMVKMKIERYRIVRITKILDGGDCQ